MGGALPEYLAVHGITGGQPFVILTGLLHQNQGLGREAASVSTQREEPW